MKPTFYKDIDSDIASDMFIASQVLYDLKAFGDYINSLLMSKDKDNILLARDILDALVAAVKSWPHENTED